MGKFGHSFRMRLFEEHFGVAPGSDLYLKYSDPVGIDTWFLMQEHAMDNSVIYESVFGCFPADSVTSFRDMGVDYVCVNVIFCISLYK